MKTIIQKIKSFFNFNNKTKNLNPEIELLRLLSSINYPFNKYEMNYIKGIPAYFDLTGFITPKQKDTLANIVNRYKILLFTQITTKESSWILFKAYLDFISKNGYSLKVRKNNKFRNKPKGII